jgi:hypothetical protein
MLHLSCPAVGAEDVLTAYTRGPEVGPKMGDAAELNGSRDAHLSGTGWILRRRHLISIILACLAIVLEVYYAICAGSCSYLSGTLLGIDLQYVGMAYMCCIILFAILRRDTLLILLISAGVGIELYLIGFQVWYNTYCPYCLAFAAIVFVLFALNFRRDRKALCVMTMAVALILFALFFKGSLAPSYSYTLQVPSIGGSPGRS